MQTASWGRRLLALALDWLASTLVVIGVIGPGGWSEDRLSGLFTMAVFLGESTVLTALAGGSFGKLLTRLRTVRFSATGGLDPLRSLARAVLVCLVIPPLVFRPDGRGLHDLVADSVTVPLDQLTRR